MVAWIIATVHSFAVAASTLREERLQDKPPWRTSQEYYPVWRTPARGTHGSSC